MDLSPAELSSLATFFAKRFPTVVEQSELAAQAELAEPSMDAVSPQAAWERIVADAQDRGRLAHLAKLAASRVPQDDNLRRAAALMAPAPMPSVVPRVVVIALGVGIPALILLMIAVLSLSSGALRSAPSMSSTSVFAAPVGDGGPTAAVDGAEPSPVAAPSAAPTAPAAPVAASTPPVAPVTVPRPPVVPARPVTPAAAPAPPVAPVASPPAAVASSANELGRCTLREGGLVGYWYAGESSPGAVGEVITTRQAMNVRAYYPNEANRFDLRGPVRCVLATGDRVRLSHPPVAVPVDAYWVPLYSGDLLSQP